MSFSLRIDIDTRKGLKKGVPFLRRLSNKFNVDFSYYIPIGGESNLIELMKYRGNNSSFSNKYIPKLNFFEKLRMVLKPVNFFQKNADLLKELRNEGNEVGVHGFKHREWTRSIDKLNLSKIFEKIETSYMEVFDDKPKSFAAPGFITNEKVLSKLDEFNYCCASDLENKTPFIPNDFNHVQVPITMKHGRTPFIEYHRLRGKTDHEIMKIFEKKLSNSFSSMYIHPAYEAIKERDLLKKMIKMLDKKGIEVKTIIEVANSITDSRS